MFIFSIVLNYFGSDYIHESENIDIVSALAIDIGFETQKWEQENEATTVIFGPNL